MNVQHEQLLQRSIDGDLGPEERAQLDDALAASELLRAQQARLERVAAQFRAWPEEEPPAGMRESILAAIRPARRSRVAQLRPSPRELAFLLTGIAASLLIFFGAQSGLVPSVSPEAAVGTMLPADASTIAIDGRVVARYALADDAFEIRWEGVAPARYAVRRDAAGLPVLEFAVDGRIHSVPLESGSSP